MNPMPDMNQRLKRAAQSEPVPPYLENKIRSQIRAAQRPNSWMLKLVPVAVALAVCAGTAVAYQLGHLRLTTNSQEAYIGSVSRRVATLMRVGLGDHIHCSVFRKYPKNPPKTEEFVAKLGPEYSGLIPIVREQIPEDYKMMIGHQCRYNGRKFIHLSLMNDSHLLSLAITKKTDGESFDTEGMLPALTKAGIPMYQAGVQRFQISAFETPQYLVYFISDLSKEQNSELMLALAPQVKAFLN